MEDNDKLEKLLTHWF